MTLALVGVLLQICPYCLTFQLPYCFIFSRAMLSLKAKKEPLHLKEWNVKCLGFKPKLTAANFKSDLIFAAIKVTIPFL